MNNQGKEVNQVISQHQRLSHLWSEEEEDFLWRGMERYRIANKPYSFAAKALVRALGRQFDTIRSEVAIQQKYEGLLVKAHWLGTLMGEEL